MECVGLTRSSIVIPIVGFLDRVGAPVERMLVRAALPPWVLTDPEALIPASGTARLLTQAAKSEGIDNLGLLAGQEASIESLGVFGRLIRRQRTLGQALEATVRNHRTFSSNGHMWLTRRGDQVLLAQAFANSPDEGWLQASHYILMLMLGIVRLGAGPTWRPSEVQFQTAEFAPVRDAEPLSAAQVAFEQPATGIVLPHALLGEPLPPARHDLRIADENRPGGRDAVVGRLSRHPVDGGSPGHERAQLAAPPGRGGNHA
jgi:hypothetical protein